MPAVNNDQWDLIATAPAKTVIQATGDATIAFVFAAALPGAGTLLGNGEHFKLKPYDSPFTVIGLDVDVQNLYARTLGPANRGFITVYTP
jgi:hypothetical protein